MYSADALWFTFAAKNSRPSVQPPIHLSPALPSTHPEQEGFVALALEAFWLAPVNVLHTRHHLVQLQAKYNRNNDIRSVNQSNAASICMWRRGRQQARARRGRAAECEGAHAAQQGGVSPSPGPKPAPPRQPVLWGARYLLQVERRAGLQLTWHAPEDQLLQGALVGGPQAAQQGRGAPWSKPCEPGWRCVGGQKMVPPLPPCAASPPLPF